MVFQARQINFAFDSKIILVAEDYSIGSVEGVEILGSTHLGVHCSPDALYTHKFLPCHEHIYSYKNISYCNSVRRRPGRPTDSRQAFSPTRPGHTIQVDHVLLGPRYPSRKSRVFFFCFLISLDLLLIIIA